MPTFTGVYSEVPIDHPLTIPAVKPPVECLLDLIVDFDITKAIVIETPVDLTKVLVTGVAKMIFKYVADVPDQQVHGAHFDVPFNSLIVWPEALDPPPQGTAICIEPVVEKTYACLEDNRTINKVVLVRLDVYYP